MCPEEAALCSWSRVFHHLCATAIRLYHPLSSTLCVGRWQKGHSPIAVTWQDGKRTQDLSSGGSNFELYPEINRKPVQGCFDRGHMSEVIRLKQHESIPHKGTPWNGTKGNTNKFKLLTQIKNSHVSGRTPWHTGVNQRCLQSGADNSTQLHCSQNNTCKR